MNTKSLIIAFDIRLDGVFRFGRRVYYCFVKDIIATGHQAAISETEEGIGIDYKEILLETVKVANKYRLQN